MRSEPAGLAAALLLYRLGLGKKNSVALLLAAVFSFLA
jgi:hypothetical protein